MPWRQLQTCKRKVKFETRKRRRATNFTDHPSTLQAGALLSINLQFISLADESQEMSFPLDLTITGKPTPRTSERMRSARQPQRPLSANRAKSVKSNIFGGIDDEVRAAKPPSRPVTRVKSAPISKEASKKNASNFVEGGAVISKEELDEVRSITGQKSDLVSHADTRTPAPEGIPKLQLGNLVDKDNKVTRPIPNYQPSVATPNSASSVSWGTPLCSGRPPSGKKARGGGWQVGQSRQVKLVSSPKPKKHDDVPSLDLQLSKSNEGLRELAKVARQVHQDLKIEYMGNPNKLQKEKEEMEKLAEDETEENEYPDERKKIATDENEASATLALNKLGESKKKTFVEETLLVDQLSRATITAKNRTPEITQSPDRLDSKQKRHRDLFSSSSPITGTHSDSSLLKRLRFGARIITRNGHDAHREINGFFFPADGTITMYEFRQFGTRSNALPFIQRGTYPHIRGSKKGEHFTLLDIAVGNDLHFNTETQASLPDSLKSKPIITFRITELDGETKQKLIFDGCRTVKDKSERESWVENYDSAEERQQREILLALRGSLQTKLKKRAVKTMMNLAKHFRKIDKSGDGVLDKEELKSALKEFRIEIPEKDFDGIWQIIDVNGDGQIDYGEFVRGILGDMNEYRKSLVRKAFARLDTTKSGVTAKDNLKKFFSAKKHPRVLSGEITEQELTSEFISNFDHTEKKGEISYVEFEDYHEGLSIQIETDQEFATIMRSSWGV